MRRLSSSCVDSLLQGANVHAVVAYQLLTKPCLVGLSVLSVWLRLCCILTFFCSELREFASLFVAMLAMETRSLKFWRKSIVGLWGFLFSSDLFFCSRRHLLERV